MTAFLESWGTEVSRMVDACKARDEKMEKKKESRIEYRVAGYEELGK